MKTITTACSVFQHIIWTTDLGNELFSTAVSGCFPVQ